MIHGLLLFRLFISELFLDLLLFDLSLANKNITEIVPDLVFPILFGLIIGWCTVTLLVFLDKVGFAQWHRRWEVE